MNHYLFVCTANMLRSPTAEHVARLHGHLADSCGTEDFAIRQLTKDRIARAEKIICMEFQHRSEVLKLAPEREKDTVVWNIPDDFAYCDKELIALIEKRLQK